MGYELSEEELDGLREKYGLMMGFSDQADFNQVALDLFGRAIEWNKNIDESNKGSEVFVLKATVDSQDWKIRINDFPDEPMYTLCIDGKPKITFDEMPAKWVVNK